MILYGGTIDSLYRGMRMSADVTVHRRHVNIQTGVALVNLDTSRGLHGPDSVLDRLVTGL